ncbi:MAG: hypothetical protein Q8O55_08965, partial [Dehalococcoidales bacterium]|nr:hypothetical protein [Dehalococcoidales bacterium]
MQKKEFPDNPAVSIVMVFQDGAKLAYVFKKPVSQLEFFAALGEAFGKMGIDMPELEIPEQT